SVKTARLSRRWYPSGRRPTTCSARLIFAGALTVSVSSVAGTSVLGEAIFARLRVLDQRTHRAGPGFLLRPAHTRRYPLRLAHERAIAHIAGDRDGGEED